MKTHPFVQLVAVVWFFGAAACFACGCATPIAIAAVVTCVAGVGYYFLKGGT